MINPDISTDPVSTQGYTDGDMSQYYSSTYLLASIAGEDQVVYCRGYNSEGFHLNVITGPRRGQGIVEQTDNINLRRFVFPIGLYFTPDGDGWRVMHVSYLQNRSYKKGIVPDYMKVRGGPNIDNAIRDIVFPVNTPQAGSFVINRRTVVHEGKVFTYYKRLSVGTFKGSLDTPFSCIRQRLDSMEVTNA